MTETVHYQQGMLLGRTFDLQRMQPGIDIFPEETLARSKTTDNHQTSITYSVIENNQDVKNVLGVDGALSLKVKAGLCKVSGKGEYLKTQRSKDNSVEILACAHVETLTDTLTDTTPILGLKDNVIGTHYIRSITYGGDMIASIRIEGNKESDVNEIKAKVDAGLNYIGPVDIDAKGKFEQLEEDLKSVSRTTIRYFSTSLQGKLPQGIVGMIEALDDFKDQVLKSNDGRGVPLTCELLPLSTLDASLPRILNNKALDVQLTKLDDYYEDILQSRATLQRALNDDSLELDSDQESVVSSLEASIDDMLDVFNKVIASLDISTKVECDGSSQLAPAFEVYRKYKKEPGSYLRKVSRFLKSLQPRKSSSVNFKTQLENQNTFENVMQPFLNIEDLISPAPLSIALLGQLILLSLETDLSLICKDDSPPKYLTHPRSLRASLLQVCHAGWDAFNLAHKNMDAIRLKTANVPTHVNDSVKIIVAGTKDEMEVFLPNALKNIKRIATDCTKKAQAVEEKFVDVMQVISELLKLCTAKRGDHEREIMENKAALKAAELSKAQIEKEQAEAEEQLKEMKDFLRQSREDYKKALDEMPNAMSLLGMSILEKAANTVVTAVEMVSNPVRKMAGSARKTGSHGDQDENIEPDAVGTLSDSEIRHLTWSLDGLNGILSTLSEYLNAGKGNEKPTASKEDEVRFLKAQTRRLFDRKKKQGDSALSHSVSSGIEQTMALIDEIVHVKGSLSNNPDNLQKIQQKAKELDGDIQKLSLQLGVQGGSMPITATPMKSSPNVTGQSSVDAAVNQSRMKCEQTSQVMRQSMEQYNAANKRTQEANKEMAALVAQISNYELKELDFETIRKTLIQGINVMGKVKEQWSKLVQYFQMMSNIVECSLQESLNGFVESTERSQELRMKKGGQYNLSKAMRDVIYVQASKANQIAHLVQGLAGTYVEVSDKHILRPLSGLDKLMALDADDDKSRIKVIQKELQKGSEEAAEAIQELVRERHDEIMQKGYERINKYEKTMREALPPPTPAEEIEIQELREAAAKPLSEPSVDIGGW